MKNQFFLPQGKVARAWSCSLSVALVCIPFM